jgi:hypothetical protein
MLFYVKKTLNCDKYNQFHYGYNKFEVADLSDPANRNVFKSYHLKIISPGQDTSG